MYFYFIDYFSHISRPVLVKHAVNHAQQIGALFSVVLRTVSAGPLTQLEIARADINPESTHLHNTGPLKLMGPNDCVPLHET